MVANALAGTLANIRDDIEHMPPGTMRPFCDTSKAMLLQFELCGKDTSTASYTFKLQQSWNFSTLKLKDVRIVCGNDLLQESWQYTVAGVDMPTRTLIMDCLGDHNVAHHLPAVYPRRHGCPRGLGDGP